MKIVFYDIRAHKRKIIRKLGDELPHDIFVEIDMLDKKIIIQSTCNNFVNRKSQKQIVVGSNGEVLKHIGTEARIDIERYLDKSVSKNMGKS